MSTCRSRSGSACSAMASVCERSDTSTRSSGSGSSPATKSPNTASSCSPTGWSKLARPRAATFPPRSGPKGPRAPVGARRRARGSLPLACLLDRQRGLVGDLLERRLAAELHPERALGAVHLLHALDDVHGHADRARLVGERARDRLADPPRRVRRELVAAAPVELLDRTDQAERAFLDQVEEGETLVAVVLRDGDDETQVRLDHPLLRVHVAALDLLRELDLLRSREERVLAGLAEEELQRIRRRLDRLDGSGRWCGSLFLLFFDDELDAAAIELLVHGVGLERVELEWLEKLVQVDLPELPT